MKNNVVKELNTFLQGNLMATHAYDQYIHHIKDIEVKKVFQDIQKDHKQHAILMENLLMMLELSGKPLN